MMVPARIILSLAVATLFSPVIHSFPHQLALHAPQSVKSFSSDVVVGHDPTTLFQDVISRLDTGLPDGWENLVHSPVVSGSVYSEVASSDQLVQTVDAWDLDARIRGQVYKDVSMLLNVHAETSSFVSQEFRYEIPNCNAGSHPVCMHTVVVVARKAPSLQGPVELHHLYVTSISNGIQQVMRDENCRRCWSTRCCDTMDVPRPFTLDELHSIQSVLSTKSAQWAKEKIPTRTGIKALSLNELSLSILLRRYIRNSLENKDVFKERDDILFSTLKDSMLSTNQRSHSFSLTIQEENIAGIGSFLSDCLRDAKVEQSLEQMWNQKQKDSPGAPLSVECQNIKQEQTLLPKPSPGCMNTAEVTVSTQYFWVILSPRPDSIEVVFIGNSGRIVRLACVAPKRSKGLRYHGMEVQDSSVEGSVVRVSVLEEDGHFSSVRYLAQLPDYADDLNKAVMDIARYAGAHSFLDIPMSLPDPHQNVPAKTLDPYKPHNFDFPDPIEAIGKGLAAIGEGWSKLANAIGPHLTESVRNQICLGFAHYQHTVKTASSQGIPRARLEATIDGLLKWAQVKDLDVEELRKLMEIQKDTEVQKWVGRTVSYTSDDGHYRFLYFYRYLRKDSDTVDVIFGSTNSDFSIAPDTLIVNKKKVGWFGLNHEEIVEYRDIPHTITEQDTKLLNAYFEVVAYHDLAPMVNMPIPEYPSMEGLCKIVPAE